MTTDLQLDLSLLLPDVHDTQDPCVGRLLSLIEGRPGISQAHIVQEESGSDSGSGNGSGTGKTFLCLHYDPAIIPLARVERLAQLNGAQVSERYGHDILELRAFGSEDAGQQIEQVLLGLNGVVAASANLAAQQVRVEYDRSQVSVEHIKTALDRTGYGATMSPAYVRDGQADHDGHDHSDHEGHKEHAGHEGHDHSVPEGAGWYARNKELTWSLISGALLLVGWIGETWLGFPTPLAIGIFVGAYLFGGYDLLRHAAGSLRQGRFSFDIDLLMLLAAVGAAILGEWAEGAFLLFLFSLAHALEHYALDRARGAIRALAELAPSVARVRRNGQESQVPVEELVRGDIVIVRPAERIPSDGQVRVGTSSVNQAPITGESIPVEKGPSDEVYAGTVNGEGALEIMVTRLVGDRTLDRVVKLVEEAQTQKAPTQSFTDRFEKVFVPAVLIADALLIVVPPLIGLWDWGTSFYRGMALLVAASPCALALGTPSAVLAGIAQAARRGVLIKGGMYLENLGTLKAIAFDKTGTLTVGKPEVTDVVALNGTTDAELVSIAAAAERRSQHPLAEAVVRHAEKSEFGLEDVDDLQSITARGVRATVNGQVVEIGNLRLWDEGGVVVPEEVRTEVAKLQSRGRSTIIVRYNERWLGVLGVADQPRHEVRAVLASLRAQNIRPIVMLTGDNQGVGEAIGREIGVDEVRAELLPEDKIASIKGLLETHGQVAMVGDGVNDAPALARATVGIAMGGAGTAAALETADVALMADDLTRLPFAVGLSRHARAIIRQNLYVSLGVIAVLIVATVTGLFGIGPAVFVHEGSTLVVVANALRLLTYGGSREPKSVSNVPDPVAATPART